MQHPEILVLFWFFFSSLSSFSFSIESLQATIFYLLHTVGCCIKDNKALNSLVYNRFPQSSLHIIATEIDTMMLWGTERFVSILL